MEQQNLPHTVSSKEYAQQLDAQDPLGALRQEFRIPSKSDLKLKALPRSEFPSETENSTATHDPCIYLCGNSLGLQPRLTSTRLAQYLTTWSTQGVYGHFKPLDESPLPTWLDVDEDAASHIAPIVGAATDEVAVMATLTANLHFLMSAFYRPDIKGRHKIIIETKAFPSDHYAAESQILHHGLTLSESLVTISPPDSDSLIIPTEHIISIIDANASTAALLLLPGIQFYTGQLFDIKTITAHAQSKGIFVIWDLAHAVGNVPLKLHDWNVDAAAWCSYKYLNAGPGCIGGLFVHDKHSPPPPSSSSQDVEEGFSRGINCLNGWWGSSKTTRFAMENRFTPIRGAGSFQLSNPSALDITALVASLDVFAKTSMTDLRTKSLRITAYLETLLLDLLKEGEPTQGLFKIITPTDPEQRGAQLSLFLSEGLLDCVMKELEENGVVVDERRPDVIRVAPAPLYNSFEDVWLFVQIFRDALIVAQKAKNTLS